jgi:hypothetical protein
MDAGENLYLTWATNDRVPGSTGGCNGAETPKPSSIKLVIGRHQGPGRWQWSAPLDISPASAGQDMWPWVAAGDAGRVSVVWYHRDKLDDIDCGQLNGVDVNSDTFIYEAHIIGAEDPTTRTITVTNASRRSIHRGQICMSGTQCVATGKDRRLGDFLTNAVDGEGCVLIASGDTEVPQAQGQALSRPIFIRQTSGPSLTGKQCGAPSSERMLTAAHASSRLPGTSPDAPAFWLMILPTAALALRRRPGHSRLP